jgi:hypothetical protein
VKPVLVPTTAVGTAHQGDGASGKCHGRIDTAGEFISVGASTLRPQPMTCVRMYIHAHGTNRGMLWLQGQEYEAVAEQQKTLPTAWPSLRQSRWLDTPMMPLPCVSQSDGPEGHPMAEDLSHTLLATSRKHLILAIRTLVMRDLFRHRTNLIKQYLRQRGMTQDWDAFMANADLSHGRAISELLKHDKACRILAKAKAELDRILTMHAYAECTAPLFTSDLHHTALRLVTHRLTFAEDQFADATHDYSRELWEEQLDYYRELQAILHTQAYDSAALAR